MSEQDKKSILNCSECGVNLNPSYKGEDLKSPYTIYNCDNCGVEFKLRQVDKVGGDSTSPSPSYTKKVLQEHYDYYSKRNFGTYIKPEVVVSKLMEELGVINTEE